MNILFVDDERGLLDQAKIFLERYDYNFNIVTTISAVDALKIFDENEHDVIVSDYQMPDMNGLEFLETIRNDRGSDIPFIMFTGKGREEVAIEALNLGADRYIQKGGDPTSQYRILNEAIKQEYDHYHSDKLYRTVVKNSHDGVYIYRDDEFLFVNDRITEISGYSKEELYEMSVWDTIHPDHKKEGKRIGKKRLEGEDVPSDFTTKIITKDGNTKHIDITVSSILYKGEKASLGTARDITERIEKEKKIRFQADLLNKIEHAVIATDMKGKIIYWNHHAENLYGWNSEDVAGDNIIDVTPSLMNKEKAEEIMQKMKNGEKWSGNFKVKNKEGDVFTAHVTNSPLHDDKGDVIGVVGVSYDVTEQNEAKRFLKKRNKELEAILENMLNPFVLFESVFDEEGEFVSYRFEYINEAYEEITGVKQEEVKGKTVHEVWPETEDEWIERYGEVAVTGESQTFELYHGPTDKLYHCKVYRPYDTKDKFCVIFEDITDRREKEKKLRRERRKFREIFNNVNDAIYMHELDDDSMPGKFIEVNETASEMLGYTKEEFLKMSPKDVDTGEEANDRPEVMKTLLNDGDIKFNMKHEAKDGTVIPVEIHSHKFELDGDEFIVSVARDVTEKKKSREREEFLHSLLRHDLKNKLRITEGYLELLEEGDLSEEYKMYIEKALSGYEQSMDIINKVKELREVDDNNIRDVKIYEMIDEVIEENKGNAESNSIEIISRIDSDRPHTVKGGKLLNILFTNLIENAVKHADCDKIVISGEKKDDHHLITVEDDGKGIPDDKKEEVLKRGFKHGKEPGTGLGLYMVKRILENYGGSIEVKDSELGGARFDIYFNIGKVEYE